MSWLSDATGIHIGGNHQKLIDMGQLARAGAGVATGGLLGGALGGVGNILNRGGNALSVAQDKAGLGGVNPLLLALAGLQGFNAADLSKKSTKYATDAFSGASQDWKDRSGLRSMGIAGLESNARPDLSELTSIRRALPGAAGVGVTGGGPVLPPLAGGTGAIADGPMAPTPIPQSDPGTPVDPTPYVPEAAGKAGLPDQDRIRSMLAELNKRKSGGGLSPQVTY